MSRDKKFDFTRFFRSRFLECKPALKFFYKLKYIFPHNCNSNKIVRPFVNFDVQSMCAVVLSDRLLMVIDFLSLQLSVENIQSQTLMNLRDKNQQKNHCEKKYGHLNSYCPACLYLQSFSQGDAKKNPRKSQTGRAVHIFHAKVFLVDVFDLKIRYVFWCFSCLIYKFYIFLLLSKRVTVKGRKRHFLIINLNLK